ncbi:MAG: helicase HerA-like domain-containing protein, partial [Candidatus Limnocylindrales bacterium]
AAQEAMAAGVPATTAGGLNTMTPAQQQREIARQAREMATAQRAADRARATATRQAREDAKERNRMVKTGVSTAGKVITSRAGQDFLRGVFGTLFGGKK